MVSDNAECEEETEEDMELNDEDEGDNSNDDDPTWTPEEIDREYQKLKNEDDSQKTHDNPRLTNNTVLSLCYTEWWPELLSKLI